MCIMSCRPWLLFWLAPHNRRNRQTLPLSSLGNDSGGKQFGLERLQGRTPLGRSSEVIAAAEFAVSYFAAATLTLQIALFIMKFATRSFPGAGAPRVRLA